MRIFDFGGKSVRNGEELEVGRKSTRWTDDGRRTDVEGFLFNSIDDLQSVPFVMAREAPVATRSTESTSSKLGLEDAEGIKSGHAATDRVDAERKRI